MPARKGMKQAGKGKPFPKGVVQNPGGRTKYGEISKAIRYILDLPDMTKFKPGKVAELIALGQIQEAIKKNRGSAEFVANRAEGMPTATVKSSIDLTNSQVIVDILKNPDATEG